MFNSMSQKADSSLGTPENPLPSWAILNVNEVQEFCTCAGKQQNEYYDDFLPALVEVVRRVEGILRDSGRTDCQHFFAQNILKISNGQIFVKIFSCVNGNCHVPAEVPFATGVGEIRHRGWYNLQFDFNHED